VLIKDDRALITDKSRPELEAKDVSGHDDDDMRAGMGAGGEIAGMEIE